MNRMVATSLQGFLSQTQRKENEKTPFLSSIKLSSKSKINFQPIVPQNLPPSYLVSATYDGEKRAVCIKLYEPKSAKIFFWYSGTEHRPYCLTNLPPQELEKIGRLMLHPGFDHFESVRKYDPLLDREVNLTKVVAKDPLAIGGRAMGCIRDIIPEDYPKVAGNQNVKVWEAFIKYYQCYIYDQDLAPGMIYRVANGGLVPVEYERSEDIVNKIRQIFQHEPKELLQRIEKWARLLECPVPDFRRVALDIEVFSPVATRVPDPTEAAYEVICVSLLGSDDRKRVLLLKREGVEDGAEKLPPDVKIEYYNDERELLLKVFEALWDYPFVVTFNGDDFDLRYLWRRAQNLNFRRSEVPIEAGRRVCLLTHGIHLDLYQFFRNRSIQVYAFSQKYRGVTLNELGEALIGKTKIELERPLSELTYTELAQYCLRDAEITLDLTTFDNNLVMKLILALTRISRMPMEDVTRQGVSRWIRSFLQYEHRRRNILIPNAEDILALKGKTATKAIIKGKKYKGAIVVEPKPGVHFNVAVMDFSSLYPSIIKIRNLGYQTILCPHQECKVNKVPETDHWICTKRKALESLLIGSLRDLRVEWYKPKSKDKTLSNEMQSWYNVIQSALKVILNASYGVFGAETFDLYCPPVAEATAAYGRQAITQTVKEAEELGIDVLYGDTDSIFLSSPSKGQMEDLTGWSEKNLKLDLDLDKTYRYSVLSSRKKNYLGVYSDGTVEVKGLTGKKRHIPELIEKAFNEMKAILGKVTSREEMREAKKEIQNIVRNCYLRLKRRDFELDELAFHVVLGKPPRAYTKTTPQHVKAALLLQEKGIEVKAGDEIKYVQVMKDVKPLHKAYPISRSEVNVDKYVGYLQSTFDQVLDALDLDFNEIIGLTSLDRFM